MNGHRASFLVSCAAPGGGPPSLTRAAGARQRSFAALGPSRTCLASAATPRPQELEALRASLRSLVTKLCDG
jgi:hypothetical protein